MPDLRESNQSSSRRVLAVLCSDIHLSAKAPVFRSAEEDWFEAQARPLRQLKRIAINHNAPILCAGDVFHKWKSIPQLINFAIDEMPKMWSIPGQHDLPYHDVAQIKKSAFWTLCQSNTLSYLGYTKEKYVIGGLTVYPFPWGKEITPCQEPPHTFEHRIALIHSYIWMKGCSHPKADSAQRVKAYRKKLEGYDVAAFGDNHLGFLNGNILNCGGFIRRNSDQIDYKPTIGLYWDDGTIERVELDTSEDKHLSHSVAIQIAETLSEVGEFVAEINKFNSRGYDYKEVVIQFMDKEGVSKEIREIILDILEEDNES